MLTRLLPLFCLVLAAGAAAAPARASTAATGPTEVIAVDTSVPGQVTATVQTSERFVEAKIRDQGTDPWGVTGPATRVRVPKDSGGRIDVTVDAWGFEEGDLLMIMGCPTATAETCSWWADVPVAPVGVDPQVDWPEQTLVGAGQQPYTVVVDDSHGGGTLRAVFGDMLPLERHGTSTLSFADGINRTGRIQVLRCTADGLSCAGTGVTSPPIEVRTSLPVVVSAASTDTVAPDDSSGPDAFFHVGTSEPGAYLLDWRLRGTSHGASSLPAWFAQSEDDESAQFQLPVDLTGVRTGTYHLVVTLRRDYPGYGVLAGTSEPGSDVWVDSTAPGGRLQLSDALLAPHRDSHLDSVTVSVRARSDDTDRYRVELSDPSGRVVRHWAGHMPYPTASFEWNGSLGGGRTARAGLYTLRGTTIDRLGNSSTLPAVSLRVSGERLVSRTFRRTVTPVASLSGAPTVGRCSRLDRSVRGWKGSLGYRTAFRCQGDVEDTIVSTVHRMAVPRAHRYGLLRISTYGGASSVRRGSYLFLDQYSRAGRWGRRDTRLHYRTGDHPGPTRNGQAFVRADRSIYWGAYTYGGAAYDVRSFTVALEYQVLVGR